MITDVERFDAIRMCFCYALHLWNFCFKKFPIFKSFFSSNFYKPKKKKYNYKKYNYKIG